MASQTRSDRSILRFLGATPLARRRALWGIALVAPNVFGLFFFFGIPVLIAFATSFNEWNGIRPPEFIGLRNFQDLFADRLFWRSLLNTLALFLMSVPTGLVLSLGVAVLLNQKLPGRNIFRTIYFLPVVTSTVAASIVWTWIFQPRYGLLAGLVPPLAEVAWLTSPNIVILIPIAVVTVWQRLGFNMVLFLAGLQAIPKVLYEAALIDGANRWQRFWRITLPLLSPTTFLILVLNTIGSFQIFDQVYVMTSRTARGGPGGSASTLSYFLYDQGFTQSEFGYASAVALVLFLIILGFTIVQLRFQRRWVYYEAGDV
jgi:multiple sugar transport system permease protein